MRFIMSWPTFVIIVPVFRSFSFLVFAFAFLFIALLSNRFRMKPRILFFFIERRVSLLLLWLLLLWLLLLWLFFPFLFFLSRIRGWRRTVWIWRSIGIRGGGRRIGGWRIWGRRGGRHPSSYLFLLQLVFSFHSKPIRKQSYEKKSERKYKERERTKDRNNNNKSRPTHYKTHKRRWIY